MRAVQKCLGLPAAQNPTALGCQAAPRPAQHAHTLSVGIKRSKSSGHSLEGDFYLQFTGNRSLFSASIISKQITSGVAKTQVRLL